MTRRLTPQTTLENLKKEAKRFLKALAAGDKNLREKLLQAWPDAPAKPVLRDIQYAIARQYGFENWKDLKQAIERHLPAETITPRQEEEQLLGRFFEYACPDHHVRGRPAHRIAHHAALRMLGQHPELAVANFYAAIVCGEIEEVERILRERPQLACTRSSVTAAERSEVGGSGDIFKDLGPKGWEPLLYLCFTRLDLPKVHENAPAIARLLLDHGADPNVHFMAGDSRYTPLVGVIGEGEEERPMHSRRDELARLLLERGAEPYDSQVVYNIHFRGKILWWMKLMFEFSTKAGRKADWDDPDWHMLDQGGYGTGARWHLRTAIEHDDLELTEWCLQHGANPNAAPERDRTLLQSSLYEQALRLGQVEMAELLARFGAKLFEAPHGEDAFVAACLRGDPAAAEAMVKIHPEWLTSHVALHAAAQRDRADVVELVLDLGVSPNVENPKAGRQTALHVAAYAGSESAIDVLIRRGAKIDPVETMYDATPLWSAVWAGRDRIITQLARYSRDLWTLSFTGNVERVREVLRAEPRFATMAGESTPLFWLPEEEDKALEIIRMFLALGADASFRRKEDGLTAGDVARKRGLLQAADVLATAATKEPKKPTTAKSEVVAEYDRLANAVVETYAADNLDTIETTRKHFGRSFTRDDLRATVWRLMYKVRQASGSPEAFGLAEAQELIARTSGFPNWTALIEHADTGKPEPGPTFAIDAHQSSISPRRILKEKEWDEFVGVMREHRIPALNAAGFMTDEAMERIARLDFVRTLSLGGSRGLSNEGLGQLARMPQLESLDLSEYPGGKISDAGLEVLRYLPNLKRFEMTWQRGITDAGAANLRYCEQLESVNLMGSPTGDGAIEALRGKPKLQHLSTGRLVTDQGLALLHDFPMFKKWHSAEPESLIDPESEPTKLLIDGPFSDRGLANLAGLEGVFALDLFWHVTNITADAFKFLIDLPNLASLGCDGELATNLSFRHIAAIPRLRRLRAQEAVATDEGFEALSRSKTLEKFWGRECPHFGSRGFVALSRMPKLRDFGIGCQEVDDAALSTLPSFPSLRAITAVGFQDWGFRHIGRCEKLERLSCMYCRDTTDVSTEHIANLRLKNYYAGLTQITDRSLKILGGMTSLEIVELFETKNVTDAGLAHLAKLPRLKRLEIFGLPNTTLTGTKAFSDRVHVKYHV